MRTVSKMTIKHAMILAAGRGQRMEALTLDKPKPLLKVHGKPLIAHQIERLKAAGIQHIVINTAYKGELIEAYCGNGAKWQVSIEYSREEQALETAGGIKNALNLLGNGSFFVLNSDVFCDIKISDMLRSEVSTDSALLMLVKNPSHNLKGDFSFKNSRSNLIGFGHEYTFSGIGVYHRQLFESLDDGYQTLRSVFKGLAEKNKLEGMVHQGYWFDIGTPERLSWVESRSIKQLCHASGSEL
jgi:N-acetyl-alpha-D-muramate 1-phosphate uridylyltransferase